MTDQVKPLLTPEEIDQHTHWMLAYCADPGRASLVIAICAQAKLAALPRSEPKEAGDALKALELLKELHPLERVIPTRGQEKAWWAIGALEAYLSAPAKSAPDAEGGWQPIETAPKDGTSLMVWCADREIVTLAFWLEGNDVRKGYWSGHYETITPDEPTHWQPLPQPPL